MEHGLISDIAICIVTAWVLALVAHLARQPLILAYLIAGFVIGPNAMGWVPQDSVKTISELGLILLLFMIGLEIDLKKILGAGRLITVTGISQIAGCFGLGLLFLWWASDGMRIQRLEVIYLAAAACLSSTVVVVKLLYDKREINTHAGRITLGVLVLQDVFAILFLAVQKDLADPQVGQIAWSLLKVMLLVAITFTVSRYALPPLFRLVSRLPEIVTVGSLAWCFLVGGLGDKLGLSREMGALVAGVALSTFPYTIDVTAKVTSLRDFFLTLFFVSIGMTIPPPTQYYLVWALALCAFVIASRFLSVFWPLHFMAQGHRASFYPALNLCQISEFSLVILALGLNAGHVTKTSSGVIAYTFVILAVVSTYAILKSESLFPNARRLLKTMRIKDLDDLHNPPPETAGQAGIFLLGFSWTASSLLEEILRTDRHLVPELAVIDFNPNVNHELRQRGVRVVYGDISQRDTLEHAGIHHARIVVCSLPNSVLKGTNNLRLVQMVRELNPAAKIIVYSELLTEIPELYAAGASYVCPPRIVEAKELLNILTAARHNLLDEKRAALDVELRERREVIP